MATKDSGSTRQRRCLWWRITGRHRLSSSTLTCGSGKAVDSQGQVVVVLNKKGSGKASGLGSGEAVEKAVERQQKAMKFRTVKGRWTAVMKRTWRRGGSNSTLRSASTATDHCPPPPGGLKEGIRGERQHGRQHEQHHEQQQEHHSRHMSSKQTVCALFLPSLRRLLEHHAELRPVRDPTVLNRRQALF